ncbi:MAG: M48 family metallopeptidase [Ignavibacteriales bacterium]|jgi:predicted metal-dependent hydrolase|nr:M48 family metallopeptidase [Ignavibacteriales bacterium]MBK7980518.1 M48 family metallopeptidase [Ignavibacteriota bacterium]
MREEEIEINGNSYKYEMRKYESARNIKIKINKEGIIKVSLPNYVSYLAARKIVANNQKWILKKINDLQFQKKYYYLGNNIDLIKKEYSNNKNLKYTLKKDKLIILKNADDVISDNELFLKWLKLQAEEYIPKRVEKLAKLHNFEYSKLQLKNLNTRWGSCSMKKILSLNVKLMYFNRKVIDYVIIHELCHLKEMNHSAKFWKLVQNIIPEYEIYRRELSKIIL